MNLKWDTHRNNERDKIKHGTNVNVNKTHCPRNHEYSIENTYVYKKGRHCRKCDLIRTWKRRGKDISSLL